MTGSVRQTPGRIAVVEELRGLAALYVAWFHFTNGNPAFLTEGALKLSGVHGWVGVQVFFVVSGFIIPFTMHKRGYSMVRHYVPFMAKRLVRLEPPYLACVLLSVVLGYLSSVLPGFRGEPPAYSATQLLLHVGYLVEIFDHVWVNPVFWSLAIEFQFYLVIGLLFPVIANKRRWVRLVSLGILFTSIFLPVSDKLLLPYLPVFTLGILTFHYYVGWCGVSVYCLASLLMSGAIFLTGSPVIGVAALTAALSIAFVRGPGAKWIVWLGTISYSFYLLHVPIGGRIINLGERLATRIPDKLLIGFVLAALGISIAVASLYHRLLERPSQEWSSRIAYRVTNVS
jgi:peptidoglycan/LPS O-acetylase OafA/YrhL